MGTPLPNPKDGTPIATTSVEDSEPGPSSAPSVQEQSPQRLQHPQSTTVPTTKTREDILATPSQLDTRVQYVPLDLNSLSIPGPSGIKQCFRTVKSIRRIPTLPKFTPKATSSSTISGSVQTITARTVQEPTAGASKKAKLEKSPVKQEELRLDVPKVTKKHVCYACSKRFSSPGKLSQHVLSHTGELPFSCQYCDKRFNSKFKLVRHGLIHSESRAFACVLCDKTFHRKDHLNNHARVHNPVKNLYICEKENCKKQYTSLLSFKKHVALHSAEEGNLECKICSKTFDSQADIVYHLKVHAGSRTIKNEDDKKFKCSYCGRKFFTNKDVRRHLVVHTGRRDFICQFCPQKFGRKDHLVRHVKNAHPDEQWHSSTVGASGEPLEQSVQSTSKVQVATQKKGKSSPKKSSTAKGKKKATLRVSDPSNIQVFPGTAFTLSTSDPSFIIESIHEAEKSSHPPGGESVDSSRLLLTVQRIQSGIKRESTSGLSEDTAIVDTSQLIGTQHQIQGTIKNEPLMDIKLEEDVDVVYEPSDVSLLPSTSKDLTPLLCTQSPTSDETIPLSKYSEFAPNVVYVMPPPPPYPVMSTQILQTSGEISFVSQPDQNIESVVMDSENLVPVLETEVDPIALLDQSGVQSILIDTTESGDELPTLSNQQIIQFLESASAISERPTALPTFHQAFQSAAQSPKPPQHPPGNDPCL